jgi:hypothetical protein
MSSPSENESMPTFNSVQEGSQNLSGESLSPITTEKSPEESPEKNTTPSPELQEESVKEEEVPSPELQEESVKEEEVPSPELKEESVEEETVSDKSVKEEENLSPEELNEETPSEEGEPLEEPVVSESKQMDKDKKVVDEAATFRKKLTNTKKRLPSMDDNQKDEIRNGVIREFMNILKISKRATTRKKLGRRINNLRGVFNETLDMLNGTAKKRPRKRKTKKQISEIPPAESFSENQS